MAKPLSEFDGKVVRFGQLAPGEHFADLQCSIWHRRIDERQDGAGVINAVTVFGGDGIRFNPADRVRRCGPV